MQTQIFRSMPREHAFIEMMRDDECNCSGTPSASKWLCLKQPIEEELMKIVIPIAAAAIGFAALPSFAASPAAMDPNITLAGARFCVGPGCERHHWRHHEGYGCRDITIRKDGEVKHIRRCD
jgi:hypothetical protein